ncbi:MAG TPA: hypothetical protein VNO30_09995 [Kofleriaceae bacterium]|nr:hypothetical protein [Kofleriaceae bacterium]
MWFVYVFVGLALLIASGLYARRRIAGALAHFGVRDRSIRVVRWAMAWLLFGFPVLMILSILISRLLGSATLPRFDGLVASWLLTIPFAWSMLVVFQSVLWLLALDVTHFAVQRWRGAAAAARLRAAGVLAVTAGSPCTRRRASSRSAAIYACGTTRSAHRPPRRQARRRPP